jgi:hypothetical protein
LVAAATVLLVVLSSAAQRTLGQTQTFADADARSIALFQEAGKVLQHPRCLNCPGGRRPPAPGTQAAFGALMRAWADSGARCPPDKTE